MPRAVRFEQYGGPEVLEVVDVPRPSPGPGQVLVRVMVAGTNPGEEAIRSGAMREVFPAHFPQGQGSDLAGVVDEVGDGVDDVAAGDAVIGLSDGRNAQADYAVLPADRVTPLPAGLEWAVGGGLYVAGATAVAVMRAARPAAGEVALVSGAAGGVGCLVTQLAVRAGSRVLAVASEAHHEVLRRWGAEPVAHGDGLEERLRELAPGGVDAAADTYGHGYVAMALRLGAPAGRINTVIDFAAAEEHGVAADGMTSLGDPRDAVAELAASLAAGDLELPIKARYPLERVADAYREVGRRSGLGKVVLDVTAP